MDATVRTRRGTVTTLMRIWLALALGCLVFFVGGCSVQGSPATGSEGSQSTPQTPASAKPARPTLKELVPNTVTIGSAGTIVLRGTNFVAGASLLANTPGISFRNIRVDSSEQITAEYANSPDSPLGYFRVTVTTPGGTSEPAIFTITPLVYQVGVGVPAPRPTGPAVFESLQVGIHADQVENPDGSRTDAYLNISFTDAGGRPVKVGDSTYSDMDNVDNPDDDTDESGAPQVHVTSYSFAVEKPAAGEYVLRIKSSRKGSFVLEMAKEMRSPQQDGLTYNPFVELQNVPTLPGSTFELRFVCHGDPCNMDIGSGGLRPAHGAFSFAQPLTANVQLPTGETALALVIHYDPVMEASSFRAMLDGSDRTEMFHVQGGELELVNIPVEPGQHLLTMRMNNKSGQLTEQEFHIQR